jgi:hypothetical protein
VNERAFRILQSQNNAILQKSISAALYSKMEQMHQFERSVVEISQAVKDMQSDELLRDSEYRKAQIEGLKQEFREMESRYLSLYGNLRVIGEQVVIMN